MNNKKITSRERIERTANMYGQKGWGPTHGGRADDYELGALDENNYLIKEVKKILGFTVSKEQLEAIEKLKA